MQPVLVTILDQDSQDVLLTLDASISETHSADADATDHPVEQGSNITDHIRPKPRTLSIEGIISNTPTSPDREALYAPDEPGPAEAAYFTLENRRQGGFLHTVVTKLSRYDNMALLTISEPRSASVGDALQFTLGFKEIRIVQNQTVTVQTKLPSGQPKSSTGTKVPKPQTPSAAQKTALKALGDSFGVTTPGSGLP